MARLSHRYDFKAPRKTCACSQKIVAELGKKAEGISSPSVKSANFGQIEKGLSRF